MTTRDYNHHSIGNNYFHSDFVIELNCSLIKEGELNYAKSTIHFC